MKDGFGAEELERQTQNHRKQETVEEFVPVKQINKPELTLLSDYLSREYQFVTRAKFVNQDLFEDTFATFIILRADNTHAL